MINTIIDSSKSYLKKQPPINSLYKTYRFLQQRRNITSEDSIRRSYQKVLKQPFTLDEQYSTDDIQIGEIEINKNCNLNCPFCKTQLSTRPNDYMDIELFERCVRMAFDVNKGKRPTISLHTIGEPLLHPKLEDYFRVIRREKGKIYLVTNAQFLHKRLELLKSYSDIIETIRFSVDGSTKETYEKMRTPGKFKPLMDNLELFKKANQGGRYFSHVAMNTIVSEDNRHEIAYHLGFYSSYVPMENIGLRLVDGLAADNTYFLQKSVLKQYIVPNKPCQQLKTTMHILNDGRVSACCRDYNGELIYGDVKTNTPQELINNAEIRRLRRQHIDDTIPKNSLCGTCLKLDPKVSGLWVLFSNALIYKYKTKWHVPTMQTRFDEFFEMFSKGIPEESEFVRLLR